MENNKTPRLDFKKELDGLSDDLSNAVNLAANMEEASSEEKTIIMAELEAISQRMKKQNKELKEYSKRRRGEIGKMKGHCD